MLHILIVEPRTVGTLPEPIFVLTLGQFNVSGEEVFGLSGVPVRILVLYGFGAELQELPFGIREGPRNVDGGGLRWTTDGDSDGLSIGESHYGRKGRNSR